MIKKVKNVLKMYEISSEKSKLIVQMMSVNKDKFDKKVDLKITKLKKSSDVKIEKLMKKVEEEREIYEKKVSLIVDDLIKNMIEEHMKYLEIDIKLIKNKSEVDDKVIGENENNGEKVGGDLNKNGLNYDENKSNNY